MGNKRGFVLRILVCMLIGFVCISFTSRNSFLFGFQDSSDIQIFLTTARELLQGDVLYRDIFEVKGPYLYALYVLGLLISRETLWGVYLIEGLLFSVYLFIAYKIASLFVKSVPLCFLITAITGVISTTTDAMDGGGQCEELLLPVFSMIIYVTIKYFKDTYPKRIPASKVLLVAIGFTIIFWMKYTLAGLVLGLMLYLIVIQIQDKTIQNISYYAGLFLIGIVLGTLPIIIYFTYHNAWNFLWDAYFYKLLFCYKPDISHLQSFKTTLFLILKDYIAASGFTAYAFIYAFIFMLRNEKGKRHLCGSICIMLLFQAIGISFSRKWQYSSECMHAFNAFGITMFVMLLGEVIEVARKNLPKLAEKMEVYKEVGHNVFLCIIAIFGVLLLVDRGHYIFPLLCLSVFLMAFWYYLENRERVERIFQGWKEEYCEKRKTINVLVSIVSAILLVTYTYSFSKVGFAIGIPLEKYPQYKIAQYILNNDIERPIIINYNTTDAGIYGLTNTTPPTKWVGDYNASFNEVEAMYEEYIDGQKADYIIAESGDFLFEGYQLVYSPGKVVYINEDRELELFLYAKEY